MPQDQFISAEVFPDAVAEGLVESERLVSPLPWKGRRLLWVDDSPLMLSLYQSVFESLGFEVLTTSSHAEALHYAGRNAADVAILDYDMPEMNGEVLASLMKRRCPMLPVILYSASTSIPRSAYHCVDAICLKAAPREELLTMIERLSRKDRESSPIH
jgi:DNA-binding NtrC family response regulator